MAGDFDRGTVDQRIPSAGLRPSTAWVDLRLRRFSFFVIIGELPDYVIP